MIPIHILRPDGQRRPLGKGELELTRFVGPAQVQADSIYAAARRQFRDRQIRKRIAVEVSQSPVRSQTTEARYRQLEALASRRYCEKENSKEGKNAWEHSRDYAAVFVDRNHSRFSRPSLPSKRRPGYSAFLGCCTRMMQVQISGSVFDRIQKIGLIPAVRTADSGAAVRTAAAIASGGIPVVEISLAPPDALDTLARVVRELGSEVLIGAGTVLDAEMVRRAHEAGCQFIVTTGFDRGTVEMARQVSLPIFPGAMTPTEVQAVLASGCHVVKLFPCYATKGPAYLRTLRAQYPSVNFIASGGVTLENCPEYFHAGACAVGVGSAIADSESISLGEFRIFKERAKRFRKVIAEAQARWHPDRSMQQA